MGFELGSAPKRLKNHDHCLLKLTNTPPPPFPLSVCVLVWAVVVAAVPAAVAFFVSVFQKGSRIEASSVVVKPVAPYSVNRGVPSKRVAFVVCDPYQDLHVFGGGDLSREEEDGAGDAGRRRIYFSKYCSLYLGV